MDANIKTRVYCDHCFCKFFTEVTPLRGLTCIKCKKVIFSAAKAPINIEEKIIEEEKDFELSDEEIHD